MRRSTTRSDPARRDIVLRSQLVAPVLAYVRARGGDVERLRNDHSLPDDAENAPEVRLPLRTLQTLLADAARESRDPDLGLHVAERTRSGTWGILEFSSRSAPTLRDALHRVARYSGLFNDHVVVSFTDRAGHEGEIAQLLPGRPECLGRHGNEFFVATIVHRASALVGRRVVPLRVRLAHSAVPSRAALREVFGACPIELGAERNAVVLGPDALDRPLVTSDPALLSLLDRYAQKQLEERASAGVAPDRFAAAVRAAIRRALADGQRPRMRAIARDMRVSERTFQRRLGDESTSFADLLDGLREELARAYARDSSVPIGAIAYLLGYSELRPFFRAFRRWTGVTPGAFRAAIKADKRT